ncbi:hypothetical protein GCM10023084_82710 [Streptomyces lacrimifluminis]|uniref:Uncharacterized protein n=1 Tax=Streptomyces lacrimifluminis TaxID=1500077 RepID=A0A917PED3_9ACTN|nr:hypothetical protein [Streptomyces lacrimifluminis]GGJ72427.1 hypothetical protein GCM10012282_81580 [Streptomyces lacrimifluminis]
MGLDNHMITSAVPALLSGRPPALPPAPAASSRNARVPLDPNLGIEWPADAPLLSGRDAAAPYPAEMAERALLPSHEVCLAHSDLPDR